MKKGRTMVRPFSFNKLPSSLNTLNEKQGFSDTRLCVPATSVSQSNLLKILATHHKALRLVKSFAIQTIDIRAVFKLIQ